MKREIFDRYVTKVADAYGVEEEVLFHTTRKQTVVDARHMLFYLCITRPMAIYVIREYMASRGLPIQQSAIMNGVRKAENHKHKDKDYAQVLSNIANTVKLQS
jgi:chromosomal replication initiation ATPase DnaA